MNRFSWRPRVAAALVLIAALASCTGDGGSGAPKPSRGTTPPAPVRMLYETDLRNGAPYDGGSDLWRYDYPSDAVTRITEDEGRNFELMPRFHGERITFITAALKRLVEFDPARGSIRTLLETSGAILAYAWHGDEVAYLEVNYTTDSIHHLRVLDTASGKKTTIKKLGSPPGRGTTYTDVLSIAWSGDGERILLTDTHLDDLATVRVLKRDGSDVIAPLKSASNALWSQDGRAIYVRFEGGPRRPAEWSRMDLADGSRHVLSLDGAGHHATLSPDGRFLAATVYDKVKETYGIDVLDLAAGASRRIVTGAVDPVWFGDDSFAATQIDLCGSGRACGGEEPYHGRGAAIYRLDGTRTKSKLVSTFWDLVGRNNTDVVIG
jgi:dipeptidyl aminopeptidase/acylaminoacyl peptidase